MWNSEKCEISKFWKLNIFRIIKLKKLANLENLSIIKKKNSNLENC